MGKKILVLNADISGMNAFMFSALRKRGLDLLVREIPESRLPRYWSAASTFSADMKLWREKFGDKLWRYTKSPEMFIARTKYAEKLIEKYANDVDCILQFQGLFGPSLSRAPKPYVIFTSWTSKLTEREWPAWNPIKSVSKLERWYSLEKLLYNNAASILVSNNYVIASLTGDYGADRNKIARVGYGAKSLNVPDVKKKFDGRTILFVGYQFDRKGGGYLVEAFKKVRMKIPDARLVIVGPEGQNNPRMEGVEFRGAVDDRFTLEECYNDSSIFAMPSLCEPFGLAFLEAMGHKLPCIGTTKDAMPEIIEDGVTGFTVGPADADALAAKMIQLLRNQELMTRMGEAGFRKVSEEFTWDKVADRIISELDKIC